MSDPDPLDLVAALLLHACPEQAERIARAIAEVRDEFGGNKVYLRAGTQDRATAIRAALASGACSTEVAARFGVSRQTVGYHARKLSIKQR